MIKKLALKDKKGFTLIEIIVVLVILAILAAASIPTMIGFVNDARGKAMIAEARAVFIAGQSIATELQTTNTGTGANKAVIDDDLNTVTANRNRIVDMVKPDINIVAATPTADNATAQFKVGGAGKLGQVTELIYTKKIGEKTVTITLAPPAAAVVTMTP